MRTIVLLVIAFCTIGHPLAAQKKLPPRVIGQIVDEVLHTIVPPDTSLSRMPIRERGMYLDYARTLAAFGYRDDSTTRAALALKAVVKPGDLSLLDDCNQVGTKPCERLGQSAYVYVEPRSQSGRRMLVRLHVHWPDRGGRSYVPGDTRSDYVFLYGFVMEVHLTRAPDGTWRFARIGATLVSD